MIEDLKTSTRNRVRYEYKCPFCGCRNVRYEKCRRIVCDFCKREFVPRRIIPYIRGQLFTHLEGRDTQPDEEVRE